MTPGKRRYSERQAAGQCPYGKNHGPPLPGKKACAHCLKQHRHAMQRYVIRQKRLKAQAQHQQRQRHSHSSATQDYDETVMSA